jgi:hypothetical protein
MDLLIQLLLSLTSQIGPISELMAKMNSEGRTTLTPEEHKIVNDAWNTAHTDAQVALAEARAQGR